MSEETPEATPEDVVELPAEPLPNSWIGAGIGLLVVAGVSALTVFLTARYLGSRPMDLRGPSRAAVSALEDRLYANRVPEANILAADPLLRTTPQAHWYLHDLEVEVPAHLNVEGIEALLDKEMRRRNVTVSDYYENGQKEGLRLGFGDFEFATVRLWQSTATRAIDAPPWSPVTTTEAQPLEPEAEALTAEMTPDGEPGLPVPTETQPVSSAEETPPAMPEEMAEEEPVDSEVLEPMDETADPIVDEEDLPGLEPATEQRPWTPPTANARAKAPPPGPRTQTARLLPKEGQPRLAIIVDDGGWEVPAMDRILAMNPNLTLSILPYTPKGTELAVEAAELGFEIMLHMPMENMNPDMTFEGQLTTAMSEDEIAELTQRAMKEIPGAVGINNHTGSKFTADPRAMALFLSSLVDTGLYFIDSVTTAETRAFEMAHAFGIKSARRDLFLDHDKDEESIRKRFRQVLDMAVQEGEAIAICHFIPSTVTVLEELLPTLEDEGIALVHASELVK